MTNLKLAENVVSLFLRIEQQMLVNLAKRLSSKTKLLKTDPEVWHFQQLQMLGLLDKENLNFIKKYAGLTSSELNNFMYQSALDGMNVTDEALKKATKAGAHLVIPKPAVQSPVLMNILGAYQKQAANTLNLTNQTLIKQSKKMYVEGLNKAVADIVSGAKTHDQALRSVIRGWSEKGIPALIDKAGREWGTEGYVRTVLITSSNNTINEMQRQRYKEWDVNLVEVSSHVGARERCAPYQGRIFALDYHPKYENLYHDTSMGEAAGLFGVNCKHRQYPYIEGMNVQTYFPYDEEVNEKVYKESQIQRSYERDIRKAKTRYEMNKAAGDLKGMEQANALIKQRQARMRNFIDNTGRTRRYGREQVHGFKGPELKDKLPKTPKMKTGVIEPVQKPVTPKPKPVKEVTPKQPVPKKTPTPKLPKLERDLSKYVDIGADNLDIKRDADTFVGMAKKDSAIVNKYTSSYYMRMNEYLRTGVKELDRLPGEVEHLKKVLSDNAKGLSQNTIFHRNFSPRALPDIFGMEAASYLTSGATGNLANAEKARKMLIGGAMEDKAFVSSTYVKGSFGGYNDVKVEIYAPKGYKGGMFVESISEYRSEREYLFNAGKKFDILDLVFADGRIILKLMPTN